MGDDADHATRGAPPERGSRHLRIGETEPRALGLPRTWFPAGPVDLRPVRHPLRWLGWRREVRRRGPYAPRFEDFRPR